MTMKMASGLSIAHDAVSAAEQACELATPGLEGARADLAIVFFTSHHTPRADEILNVVGKSLDPANVIGVSAESVAGGAIELERVPGISVLAASLPGVRVHAFDGENLLPADSNPETLDRIGKTIGTGPDHRATIMFADPFSVPAVKLIPALNRSRHVQTDDGSSAVIVGGMASAGRAAGKNALLLNDRVMQSGIVGVSLSGNVRLDAVVSQGCRPFGPAAVVTKARGNMILELAGKPPAETIRAALQSLGENPRHLLKDGLLVGRVINEYKPRFGRSDFLIRNVVGLDHHSGGIAVADIVRVGQTIRFHIRDRATATEDLALLMDSQKLHERPAGCLLITCNARGARLFGKPNHDAAAVTRAFAPPSAGEELARGGSQIDPSATPHIPLAGFFAAGEIGPIGDESYLHGHTACIALFRERERNANLSIGSKETGIGGDFAPGWISPK